MAALWKEKNPLNDFLLKLDWKTQALGMLLLSSLLLYFFMETQITLSRPMPGSIFSYPTPCQGFILDTYLAYERALNSRPRVMIDMNSQKDKEITNLDTSELIWSYACRFIMWSIYRIVFDVFFLFWIRLVTCSKNFVAALKRVRAEAEVILYDGKTHTDLFLQVSCSFHAFFFLW